METVKAGEKGKAREMENGKMDCLEAVTCQGNVSNLLHTFLILEINICKKEV